VRSRGPALVVVIALLAGIGALAHVPRAGTAPEVQR
jgi:hypothetical protein